ncbi:MAG: hypothetical protein U0235_14095 [Polyangiaceae bacterium]
MTGQLLLRAGSRGGLGTADGLGADARFSSPYQVAADANGNVFVVENCMIRRVTPQGDVTTIAGQASACVAVDGTGAAARFYAPKGIAVATDGTLFVVDGFSVRTVSPSGLVSTWVGDPTKGGRADGIGTAARFTDPRSIALDSHGNVFVADFWSVRRVDPTGEVTTFAGAASPGCTDGVGALARIGYADGIATDANGNVYLGDTVCHTLVKIDSAGGAKAFVGTPGYGTSDDGNGSNAHFGALSGVAVTATGDVYVADESHHNIRRVTASRDVTTIAGVADSPGAADGAGTTARFNQPWGVTSLPTGGLVVTDQVNRTLRFVTASGDVTTLAGLASGAGSADGVGAAARFRMPSGQPSADSAGNVVVPDAANHTIRRVTPAGVVTTLAGAAEQSGNQDGVAGAARFTQPRALTVDAVGNIFIADSGNHLIRKLTPGGDVSTVAGSRATYGAADGAGSDAQFYFPAGIAVDESGVLFVADMMNATIRRIDTGGVVTTIAGSPGVFGHADGFGNAATFSYPSGLAIGPGGELLVVDSGNGTIRKVGLDGQVVTIAGAPGVRGHEDGLGADARFNYPVQIAATSSGALFIADSWNCTVRRFLGGVLSTVVGVPGQCGVRLGPLPARLNEVVGVTVLPSGGLAVVSENALVDVVPQ